MVMNSIDISDIDARLQEAVACWRAGDLDIAERLFNQVLQCDPENADALHFLGLIDFDKGNPEKAIFRIQRAIDADPRFADFHRSLGNIKRRTGQLEEALSSYHKAISINSKDIISLYEAGSLSYQMGRLVAAECCYKKCIQLKPNRAGAYNNLGLIYKAKKQYRLAGTCFRRALEIDPHLSPVRCNLAVNLMDQGDLANAIAELKNIIDNNAGYPEAHYHLGMIQAQIGNITSAISAYKRALNVKNDFVPALNNMGILLQYLGRTREAIHCFHRVIQLDPKHAMAHYNLGILYKYHANYSGAVKCMRKALEIDPEFVSARNMLAICLRDVCQWPIDYISSEIDKSRNNNDRLNALSITVEDMFGELSTNYLERVLISAKKKSREIEGHISISSSPFHHEPGEASAKRIIIGYLSNNFRDHPTAHLVCDMFACHDRNRFKIIGYSYGENDNSVYRNKIEQGCDRFVELINLNSSAAATRIYRDKPQILVDLNGYTACSRTDICALRPAPVQVRYLGEAKTSGSSFIDYLIGDAIVTPEPQAYYYTEKLVFMPHSYQINSGVPVETLAITAQRRRFQLPSEEIVFSSFSTSYKIDPELFKCWMKILCRVPRSVLWLLKEDNATESNLKYVAQALGVKPNRLIFAQPLPIPEHLARLTLADLCLDTRAVNGAATTSDALWAGVPVITIKGRHFASRMSASILTAVGLPELITDDLRQYQELAVALANHPERLDAIRKKLAMNKSSEPLFDTQRFVRNLENAYEQMWRIYTSGENPRHIHVQDCAPSPGGYHV